MNINTSTLLTLLSTKIDKPTKQTIEKLSVEGKVDISSLLKEKSVQTLLSDLFKDVSQGVKNKSSVNQLLTSNKQIFDFKNLSSEVKNLSQQIEQNPKLEKQSAILKEFLVNIKNIDENSLKSNIKNSGVFLESKLLKSDTTISSTIKTVLGQIQEQIQQSSKNTPTSFTKVEQPVQGESKQQNIPLNKQELINNIKSTLSQLQTKIDISSPDTKTTNQNMANISNQTKNIDISSPDTKTTNQNMSNIANQTKNIDISSKDIKATIQNITNQIKNIDISPSNKLETPLLKELNTSLKTLDSNISKEAVLDSGSNIKKNIKLIMSNIQTQLDSSKQVDDMPKNKMFNNIKNSVVLIQDKIENIKVNIPESLKTEVKVEIGKVLEQIKATPLNQPQEKNISTLSDIKNSINNIETKLTKLDIQNPQNLLNSNNILNSKSIVSNDLKAAVLQIQEQIDNKTVELPKEVKIQLDKIQSQIEFYQLLSYTSTSNHTFLPFSWEDLDDADIKFDSKNKDEFSCQINLSLTNVGELKVLLQLDNQNNLNINMGVESQSFKNLIQTNLQKLRMGINSVGLMVQSLNIFDIQDDQNKTYEQNAYGTDNKLNFGLDIKA